MIVTTLPISPLQTKLFLSLTTPICADILAKYLSCAYMPSINLTGLSLRGCDQQGIVASYCGMLRSMGVKHQQVFMDKEEAYISFFTNLCQAWINDGRLKCIDINISYCPCGVVEIPTSVLTAQTSLTRFKLLSVKDGVSLCTKCKSVLQSAIRPEWVFKFQRLSASPNLYGVGEKKLEESLSQAISYDRVVSRRRQSGVLVRLKGLEINFDPDFFWSAFLKYIIQNAREQVLLVAGVKTTPQISHCLSHLSSDELVQTTCVIHPFIKVTGNAEMFDSSIEIFLSNESDPRVIRTLVALGLSWQGEMSGLRSEDLHLARKSVRPQHDIEHDLDTDYLPLCEFLTRVNGFATRQFLKKIRGKQDMDKNDLILSRVLF